MRTFAKIVFELERKHEFAMCWSGAGTEQVRYAELKIPILLVCLLSKLLMRGVERGVGEEETNFCPTTYNQKIVYSVAMRL